MKQFIYVTTFLTIMAAPVVQAAAVGDDEEPKRNPVGSTLLGGSVDELTERLANKNKKAKESLEKQERENAALKKINELKETAVGILNSASEQFRDAMTEITDLPGDPSKKLALMRCIESINVEKRFEAEKLIKEAKRLEEALEENKNVPSGGGESVSEDKRAVSGGS